MSARCGSCRAPVIWAITAAGGKRMPIDADPVDGGTIVLSADDPPIASVVAPDQMLLGDDGVRYTSHFATCPNADQHRRRT